MELDSRVRKFGPPRAAGKITVTQLHGKQEMLREFDAQEWTHEWVNRGGIAVLRLWHDRDPDAVDSFDFVEFSAPVQISFTYER